MSNKYILTNERRRIRSRAGREIDLHRIVAAKDFDVYILQARRVYVGEKVRTDHKICVKHIKAGDAGGWVESESNLSQEGSAWIDQGAVVFGKSVVKDDAWVGGEKTAICGEVVVCDDAIVFSDDMDKDKYHRTDVIGSIWICGRSKITASLRGEGIVKNLLIDCPKIVGHPQFKVKTQETPNTADPSGITIRFECSIGDKKLDKQYTL